MQIQLQKTEYYKKQKSSLQSLQRNDNILL